MMQDFQLKDLFIVKSGDYHAIKELDEGSIPLISCGDLDSGFIGYFDIPERYQYSNTITVAYNGSYPLTAKYHPYKFGAKDDIAVLLPSRPLQQKTLLYIAALLNQQIWRYSYGRKCFKAKLKHLSIQLPVDPSSLDIDEAYISYLLPHDIYYYLPKQNHITQEIIDELNWKKFKILEVFKLKRGDFHSISKLDNGEGEVRTVSRVSGDNGTVGFFIPPDGAKIYEPKLITISTVTGDAFVQMGKFIATDNVVILYPITPLRLTSLFFIQSMINQERWRYSYGRQCYKTKFAEMIMFLPTTADGNLNEDLMERYMRNTTYWPTIENAFS
jgi:hypothetical protein